MNENSEKELLKQDLNNQENPEEIKKFIEDVEVMGENEDIVEMAKQKLEEILAKANTVEKTSESQISQVESMGGSTGEIEKRTEGIDKQIEEVKTQTQEKITEVQNENQEEVKTETQEKTTETQSKPEVKSTGMTQAEIEESEKYYNRSQEYNKKYDGLKTEELKLDGQLDYLFLKNDIPNFTKLLVQKFEKEIAYKKLYIEQLKEEELREKPKNPSYDRSFDIRQNESKIKDYEERIGWAKNDVTRLDEYKIKSDGKGSSASENIKGLNPSQLAYKYYQEIKESISKEKERYSSQGSYERAQAQYNNFHRFDRLDGLIDIAKQEKNTDLLNSIKGLNLELPEEIKNKLNS